MDSVFDDLANALSTGNKNPFVDPVANMAYIGEVNALDIWEKQIQMFNEPKFLRYFLHESTHHSSFTGPVGGAFSKLALSSQSLFWTVSNGQEKYNLATRDILIYHFAWRLFEPLFEGLALFQENDALTGNSTCATNSTLFLGRFAVQQLQNKSNISEGSIFDFVKNHIQETRLISANWECSKEEILKLSITQRPYYLLGYLAIKSTYQRLCSKCPKIANDSDLFVVFMNDFWFQDYQLENILLGIAEDNNDYLTQSQYTTLKLSEYFQDKWALLFLNINKYVDECELFISQKTRIEPSYRNIEFKENPELLNIENIIKSQRFVGLSLNSIVPYQFPNIFKFRTELRYSLEEKVKFGSEGLTNEIVLYSKFGISKIPTIQIIEKGKYLGTVEAFLSMTEYKPVVIVTDGFVPIAIFDPISNIWNSEQLVEKYELFPAYPAIIKLKSKLKEFKFVVENSELEKNITHNGIEANNFILGIYGQIAFEKNGEETLKICNKLNSNGFATILGKSFSNVAKWSLWSGCGFWDLAQYSDLTKQSLDTIIKEVNLINDTCFETLKWKPFTICDNRYLTCKL